MSLIFTTTNDIPGKKITQMLGIVKGNTIRTKHIGKDIMSGLKHLVGGIGCCVIKSITLFRC